MEMATRSVEFSFNVVIYQQTDGIAIGSLLGPALANIFVGYCALKLFDSFPEPLMYYRYMDDTFVMFDNERECDLFLEQLNSLHHSHTVYLRKRVKQIPPFYRCYGWKIPIKIHPFSIQKIHFQNSTFQYTKNPIQFIRRNSFSTQKWKIT